MDNAKLWINCIEMEYTESHWFDHDELLLSHSSVKKNNEPRMQYLDHTLQTRKIREDNTFGPHSFRTDKQIKSCYNVYFSWEYCPWWPWPVQAPIPSQPLVQTLTSPSPPSRTRRTQTSMGWWTSPKQSPGQMVLGASQRWYSVKNVHLN